MPVCVLPQLILQLQRFPAEDHVRDSAQCILDVVAVTPPPAMGPISSKKRMSFNNCKCEY